MGSELELNLAITGSDSTAPAAQSATANVDRFAAAVAEMTREIVGELQRVDKGISGIGERFGKTREEIKHHSDETKSILGQLGHAAEEIGSKLEKSFSVGHVVGELGSNLVGVVAPLYLVEKGIEAVHEAIEKVVELSHEGIVKGDEVRDLVGSLTAVTGESSRANEAIEFFERNQWRTRSTAEELARFYRNDFRIAVQRGFDPEFLLKFELQLDQLTTASGRSREEIDQSFMQILAGRLRGTNPILLTLGFKKEDVESGLVGWGQLIRKVDEFARHGEGMGQTFESTMHKVKESIVLSVAEGFNEAHGHAEKGYDGLKALVSDPEFIDALKTIGSLTAHAIELVGELAKRWDSLLSADNLVTFAQFGLAGIPTILADTEDAYAAKRFRVADDRRSSAINSGYDFLQQYGLARDGVSTFRLAPGDWAGGYGYLQNEIAKTITGKPEAEVDSFASHLDEALRDNILTFREFNEAKEKAFAEPKSGGGPSGAIGEELTRIKERFEAAKRELEETAHLEAARLAAEQRLGNVFASDPAGKAFFGADYAAYSRAKSTAEFANVHGLAELYNKQQQAQLEIDSFSGQHDPESVRRVASARRLIDSLRELRRDEEQTYQLERDQADRNFIAERFQSAARAADELNLTLAKNLDQITRDAANWDPGIRARVLAEVTAAQNDLRDGLTNALRSLAKGDVETHLASFGQITVPSFLGSRWSSEGQQSAIQQYGVTERRILETGKRLNEESERVAKRVVDLYGTAFHGIEGELTDLLTSGGKDFGRIAAQTFGSFLTDAATTGLQDVLAKLAGVTGAGDKWYAPGDAHVYRSREDAVAHSSVGREFAIGSGVLSVGFGAYQSAQQAPGSRTASTIGGAVTGAEMGMQMFASAGPIAGFYGALIGAVVGALGSALGAKQRQADYKYGIPTIDDEGVGHLAATRNLLPAEIHQIEAQVQERYDAIHDSLVRLILKFPDVAIPSSHAIEGRFQDNPSAHWSEHLQQWENYELPDDQISEVGDELSTGFEQLGMARAAFKEFFDSISNLDPDKAIQILTTLATGLGAIGKATNFFKATAGDMAVSPGSHTFETYFAEISSRSHQLPGQLLAEADAEIVHLARSIKSLSPEGRAEAIAQIGQLEAQRVENEKAAIQELYNLSLTVKNALRGDNETLDLQELQTDDGSPDEFKVSQYYKGQAQGSLDEINRSANSAEAQDAFARFERAIMAAEQAGLAQASPEDRQAWIDWARNQLATGRNAVEAAIVRFGDSINSVNDVFSRDVDPELSAFATQIAGAGTTVVDFNGALGRVIEPIDRVGARANSLADDLSTLSGAIRGLVSTVDSASARFERGNSSSDFAAWVVSRRLAA